VGVMMEDSDKIPIAKAGRVLWSLAAVVIVVSGLKAAQEFFIPALLAFFVATVSFPITDALRRRRVPRSIAVLLTVLIDFAFIAGLILLGISLVGDLQRKWDEKYYNQFTEQLIRGSETLANKLDEMGVEDAKDKIGLAVQNNIANLQDIRFEKIWDFGTGLLGQVVGFFGAVLVVLILTIFMLSEARMFGRRLEAVTLARGPDLGRLVAATRDIQRYLGIKTAVSLATGVLAGFLCWAAGLDFYLLWGIFAFALNYIPVIGSIVAGVPPVILALLTAGVPNAVLVAGGYLLINNFLGNFIEPMLVGRRFGISTLVVVLSVLFWGWVWGPLGMLLAVPLTMVLKVVLDSSDEFRWIGVAISAEQTGAASAIQTLEMTPTQPGIPSPIPTEPGPPGNTGEART
jgi:AI-2 transport protein TqsA